MVRHALGVLGAVVIAGAGGCAVIAGIEAPTDRPDGGGSSVSVDGTIDGGTVPQTSATAANFGAAVVVYVTSWSGGCDALYTNPPDASNLRLLVWTGGTSVPTGTYAISVLDGGTGTSPLATATYSLTDAKCAPKIGEDAVGGSITLTTSDQTTVAGTFDVTFSGGDHLTGSFSASVCPLFDGGGAGTCGS
jgi:hypothetical protein